MASTPNIRQSDAECFSPISDVKTPQVRIPPCAQCHKPSLGGVCVGQEASHPAGAPIVTLEFFCRECRPDANFAAMSDRLFPVWRILAMFTESKMTLQKLPRESQFARVIG